MKLLSRFLVLLVLACVLLLLIPARGVTAVMATLTGSPDAATVAATGNAASARSSTANPAQATLAATQAATGATRAATAATRAATAVTTASVTAAGNTAPTFSPLVATAQRTSTPQTGVLLGQDFTLTSMRLRNFELVSPQAAVQYSFRVPDNWVIAGNNVLNLTLEYFLTGQRAEQTGTISVLSSTFQVRVDGQLISAATLANTATNTTKLAVPLTADLLNSTKRVHIVEMALNARDYCVSSIEMRVVVRADQSFMHFEYHEVAPVLDLGVFPRPFYNGLFGTQTESATLVMPAKYGATDLEYTANVAAGLGQITSNNLQLKLTTTDKLGEPDLQNSNMIVVGQIGAHPLIDELYRANLLPTKLESNGSLTVRGQAVDQNDGIVQIIAHPRNPMRAILVLTGRTPEAVNKAVRSLAGSPSLLKVGGSLALIADIRPPSAASSVTAQKDRITLQELGSPDTTLSGIGTHTTQVQFFLPAGMAVTSDAYIDLKFDYSDTLKSARTSISLLLNDVPMTSVFLGSGNPGESPAPTLDAQKGLHVLRASIPPSSLKNGQANILTVILDVQGNWNCYPPSASVVWLTVRGESELYLPRQIVQSALPPQLVGGFPAPFNNSPDLHDVWLSLPATPGPADLDQMLRMASRLGLEANSGGQFAMRVSTGNLPNGVQTANYHFIVIGRPTTNPFLAAINDSLPQPFVPGSDQLKQVLDRVEYRLPPGYTIGVLELLPSPWAADKAVLVISGIGDIGQGYAANALLGFLFSPTELQGDVVFAAANTVSYVNSRSITGEMWMPTTIADMATESATLGPGAPTRVVVYTVTPGPTPTSTITNTPRVIITPTGLFTAIPTAATSTALPTFAPLNPTDLQAPPVQRPAWVTALVLLTGGALLLTAAFGVSRFIRASRNKDRQ